MTPTTPITASGTTGWTTESVLVHLSQALKDRQDRFTESLAAQKQLFDEALASQEKKNQQQFADADKAVRAAMAAASMASDKSEQNSEKWRANANEWRAAMSDREKNFTPVSQVLNLEKVTTEIRDEHSKFRQTELEARSVLKADLLKEIQFLRESRSDVSGRKAGATEVMSYIIGLIGFIIGIAGVMVRFYH